MNNEKLNTCKSKKNAKSTFMCNRSTINNSDFCRYHIGKSEYFVTSKDQLPSSDSNTIMQSHKLQKSTKENDTKDNVKYLNDNFKHCLLNIDDSWDDVIPDNRIELFDKWWNIFTITNLFVHQLNTSKMENPYPIFPNDPFDRTIITLEDLNKLKRTIKKLNIKINMCLELLLNSKNIKKYITEAKEHIDHHSKSMIILFERPLRFKLINNKDSENTFIGHWTSKHTSTSQFEDIYSLYKSLPFNIYTRFDEIIPNYEKNIYWNVINSLKEEFCDFST